MRAPSLSVRTSSSVLLATLLLAQSPASAFLGLFEKKEKKAPSAGQRQIQDAEAAAMLMEGKAAQSAGKGSKARRIYEEIIKKHPFSPSAGEAAYAKAVMSKQTERLEDAFDDFQTFVSQYRQSPRFNDAIEQQFQLAEEAKAGKKQRSLILLPMKMGGEDVIKLYQQVIDNAPFGRLAPLAQFSIGEIHQDLGEKNEAVAAYQKVVDNYPSTKQASEAQFRIGSIANVAAKRSEDSQNLTTTRDALNTYIAAHPEGARSAEAEKILSQVNEAEASHSLEVGKFYEGQGKTKAAAIYYNEALKFGSAEASSEARDRLSALATVDPEAVSNAQKSIPDQDYIGPGASNLRSRDDYVGPMSPELARLASKPKMRTGDDNFTPIPLQEPDLPDSPMNAPEAGDLLPPVPTLERPALLPVPAMPGGVIPPQPSGSAELPVPPPPSKKPE